MWYPCFFLLEPSDGLLPAFSLVTTCERAQTHVQSRNLQARAERLCETGAASIYELHHHWKTMPQTMCSKTAHQNGFRTFQACPLELLTQSVHHRKTKFPDLLAYFNVLRDCCTAEIDSSIVLLTHLEKQDTLETQKNSFFLRCFKRDNICVPRRIRAFITQCASGCGLASKHVAVQLPSLSTRQSRVVLLSPSFVCNHEKSPHSAFQGVERAVAGQWMLLLCSWKCRDKQYYKTDWCFLIFGV